MKSIVLRSVVIGGSAIGLSLFATLTLIKLNEPPAEASTPTDVRKLSVRAIIAEPQDVTVTLNGFGEVRTRHTVTLSAEVSGRVVLVHPELVAGNVIEEGALLFAIDASEYAMDQEEIAANLGGLRTTIKKLQTEEAHARLLLENTKRTYTLAQAQLDRAIQLRKDAIGNQTDVERAEEKVTLAKNEVEAVERELSVYPIRIEEVEQSVKAEDARLKRVALDIKRSKVHAPFRGRVELANVEAGQYLNSFDEAVTLANDSILEVPIKLDARNAQQWLRFDDAAGSTLSWFDAVAKVPCEIRWTENDVAASWVGTLDRVEMFDPQSRTLTVVVEYRRDPNANRAADTFPLVSGMFCEVTIPGRLLEGAFAIPHGAIGLDEEIYVSREDRLTAIPVDVARVEGDTAYVTAGLNAGDIVVVTRLVNPLNNTLLDVTLESKLPTLEPSNP